MSSSDRSYGEPNSGILKSKGADDTQASCFFSLPPRQLALLSSLIGILLTDNLNPDQQNTLGNFIVNIGQVILTSAAQGQLLQDNGSQKLQ